jgi:hypothetical protein
LHLSRAQKPSKQSSIERPRILRRSAR